MNTWEGFVILTFDDHMGMINGSMDPHGVPGWLQPYLPKDAIVTGIVTLPLLYDPEYPTAFRLLITHRTPF